jgi:hypothetical protein
MRAKTADLNHAGQAHSGTSLRIESVSVLISSRTDLGVASQSAAVISSVMPHGNTAGRYTCDRFAYRFCKVSQFKPKTSEKPVF